MLGRYPRTIDFRRTSVRVRVLAAIGVALLVTVAVVVTRDDGGSTRLAVGAGPTSSTTGTSVEPVTTTTIAAPATTVPLASTTSLPPRPRQQTTTTISTIAAGSEIQGKSPLEPGTEEWGYGGMGASRDVTQGRTRVVWAVYGRDQYKGEELQTAAEVHDEGLVTAVHVDFGDGRSWDAHITNTCDPPPYPKPNPTYHQAPRHAYGASGDYPVTVRVTTVSCREWEATRTTVDQHTVVVTVTVHRFADRCRPSPDCPG